MCFLVFWCREPKDAAENVKTSAFSEAAPSMTLDCRRYF